MLKLKALLYIAVLDQCEELQLVKGVIPCRVMGVSGTGFMKASSAALGSSHLKIMYSYYSLSLRQGDIEFPCYHGS